MMFLICYCLLYRNSFRHPCLSRNADILKIRGMKKGVSLSFKLLIFIVGVWNNPCNK